MNSKILKQLFLSVMMCAGVVATAQTPFSLQDCIDYTLSNHQSVKVYDNNTGIAQAQSAQALGLYLPSVNGSATMLNNLELQTTMLPAGIFGPEAKAVQFGTKYSTNFGVDVSQTLYDQSKLVAIKANKPYTEMAELQKEQNRETLMYNTATAYFQVLIYQEQLRLLEANQFKYAEMVKVLEYQYSKGTVLEKDVDRVKVNLNSTNYQVEDAKTKAILALNTLKNAMGMERNHVLTISGELRYEDFAQVLLPELPDLYNLTEIKINELSVKLQEFNVQSKKAGYLPTLTAVGKWGSQALNNSFSQAWSGWNDFSYIGISLNLPLFNGLRKKNAVKEEKLKLANEKLHFQLNRQNLELRYDNAKSAVRTAYSAYQSNKDNMELARKVVLVTDYQYQHGVASLTDYLNDDAAYKAAQVNYISSLYNLMISQLSYQRSQGALPEFIKQLK